MSVQFREFPKMARFSRDIIITEKIDGTNASIFIQDIALDDINDPQIIAIGYDEASKPKYTIRAGSRSRWITPGDDNFGFANWVRHNVVELFELGEGTHFGEWWGSGIQRGYGLTKGEKRFSLFNVDRWTLHGTEPQKRLSADPRVEKYQEELPKCCGLVPILYKGLFCTDQVDAALSTLMVTGSQASPGFMKPEGIIIFHTAANIGFKKTVEKDEGKWS